MTFNLQLANKRRNDKGAADEVSICFKIKPDMVLARSIYYRVNIDSKEGQTELYRYANRLKNIGIEYVYVEDAGEGISIRCY